MAKGKKKNFSEQFLITDSSGKIEKMLTNKRQETNTSNSQRNLQKEIYLEVLLDKKRNVFARQQ